MLGSRGSGGIAPPAVCLDYIGMGIGQKLELVRCFRLTNIVDTFSAVLKLCWEVVGGMKFSFCFVW
jgi:hypothetical protein